MLPKHITSIGEYAFDGCTGLTKAEFASIEDFCKINFGNESANPLCHTNCLYINGEEVKDLVIPNGVSYIGDYVFYGWFSNTDFYCFSKDAPDANDNTFKRDDISSATLHIPAGSILSYLVVPWTYFGNIVALTDEELTGIEEINDNGNANDGPLYDLNGREMTKPMKGIYIVNGKKVLLP